MHSKCMVENDPSIYITDSVGAISSPNREKLLKNDPLDRQLFLSLLSKHFIIVFSSLSLCCFQCDFHQATQGVVESSTHQRGYIG